MTDRTGVFGAGCRRRVFGLAAVFVIAAMSGCGDRHDNIDMNVPDVPPAASYSLDTTSVSPGTLQGSIGTAPTGSSQAPDAAPDDVPEQAPVIKASGSAQQAGDWLAGDIDGPDHGAGLNMESGASDGAVTFGGIAGLPEGFHAGGVSALGLDAYSGSPMAEVHDGKPYFDVPEYPYETVIFSALDDYDRPGTAYACFTADTGGRGTDFGWKDVPAGWQGTEYAGIVPGSSLYVKARLIGSALYDSRKDGRNMLSVTQYCHDNGLEPVSDRIAGHLSEFGGYAAMRVTPVYLGTHLVCDGILIEAVSIGGTVDDTDDDPDNDSLSLCLFCYNVQPGIEIDYRDGRSSVTGEDGWSGADAYGNHDYILDESKLVFHEGACASVSAMHQSDRREYRGQRQSLADNRYEPCGSCRP